jgi:membrane protein required for colicin V production
MTALDMLVLLLVGGTGFLGLKRGFTTEILSLGAWVLAIAAVKILHAPLSAVLTGMVGTQAGAAVLAFALIFGLTMWAGKMIARKVGNQSKDSALGLFDRLLGGGFGAVKGLIGASLVFLFVSLIYNTVYSRAAERPKWMTESRSYPLLNASSQALVDLVEERQRAKPDPNSVVTAGD